MTGKTDVGGQTTITAQSAHPAELDITLSAWTRIGAENALKLTERLLVTGRLPGTDPLGAHLDCFRTSRYNGEDSAAQVSRAVPFANSSLPLAAASGFLLQRASAKLTIRPSNEIL